MAPCRGARVVLMDLQDGPVISKGFSSSSMMNNSSLMSFDKVISRVCFVVGKISSVGAGCGEGPMRIPGKWRRNIHRELDALADHILQYHYVHYGARIKPLDELLQSGS